MKTDIDTEMPTLLAATLRTDLLTFCTKSFQTLNPGEAFLANWHLEAIAYQLERCLRGDCKRLLITMPPRCLKSHMVSVSFPAFVLGCNPSAKLIAASYGQSLSDEFSDKTRSIMRTDWYGRVFPGTQLSETKNSVSEYQTTEFGFRMATSVSGTLTGRGADIIIVDDPHKAEDSNSELNRERVIRWFENTLQSRLNSLKDGCIIVVQQRIHEHDLAGHLIEKQGWEHLRLQAIAGEDQEVRVSDRRRYFFQAGEVLHKQLYGSEELQKTRDSIGSHTFAAQYQQSPSPARGNLIPIQCFKRYEIRPTKQLGDLVVQSWDLANGEKETNDYSVGTTWLIRDHRYYLCNVFREKLGYLKLRDQVVGLAKVFRADLILIENASVAAPMVEELIVYGNLNVLKQNVVGDKVARMTPGTADIEAGRVFLPKEGDWLADFEQECGAFPNSKYDDQVDSVSQFLAWARERRIEDTSCENLLGGLEEMNKPLPARRTVSPKEFYESLHRSNAMNLGHLVPIQQPS